MCRVLLCIIGHHDKDDSNKKKKRRRHNDDIYDEDVENQQPSPHPMPPIILPQAFLHAPNTFKPVSHIGAINNTSCAVLNFKNVVYSMRSCPKTQALALKVFLPLYYRTLSQNPSFISKRFFHRYISVHCPKTQALFLKVFYHYISVHCPKTQAKPGVPASYCIVIKGRFNDKVNNIFIFETIHWGQTEFRVFSSHFREEYHQRFS